MAIGLTDQGLFREACYIDGAWMTGAQTVSVDNPATGDILGAVPRFGADETRWAIGAAAAALVTWRATTARARAQILRRWSDLMLEHQEDLARLMTLEQGKPLAESRGEVAYAASFLEWFGEEAKRLYGDTIPGALSSSSSRLAWSRASRHGTFRSR
jgi:succinate-semialdehyde dehydrogenase/glutarate-semialdehyde dehydrogenase